MSLFIKNLVEKTISEKNFHLLNESEDYFFRQNTHSHDKSYGPVIDSSFENGHVRHVKGTGMHFLTMNSSKNIGKDHSNLRVGMTKDDSEKLKQHLSDNSKKELNLSNMIVHGSSIINKFNNKRFNMTHDQMKALKQHLDSV